MNAGSTYQLISHSSYLSQIISPTGSKITFKYKDKSQVPKTLSQQGLSQIWAVDDSPNKLKSGGQITPSALMENVYIDQIDFANGYAKFIYSTREDINGYKLDAIKVYKIGHDNPFKTLTFNYEYFAYTNSYGDYITDIQQMDVDVSLLNGPPEEYRKKRLKLLSVQDSDNPPYRFTYDATPLPHKTSCAQDVWGYFNGKNNKSLIPNYNLLGYLDKQVPIE
ncbi:hypothetical protein ACVW0P_002578 [Mucilaginibacter sp. UYNi724]